MTHGEKTQDGWTRSLLEAAAGRRGHWLAWSLLSITGALLFIASFERWGHPIIDLGRDLYLPSQILDGRVLYRDLLYNYGPAAPYLLAAVVALLGDGLWVFEAFGMLVGLLTLGALYAIGHRLGGALVGFTAAFLFLTLNFFAISTWGCNFVLPYSYAATLGTAFSMWSFYFLYRYLYDGRADVDPKSRTRNTSLAWSVALLFAAALSKQEVGFAIAAVHALAWWTHRVPRRAILLTLGAGGLLGVLFVATFLARDPSDHALLAENLAKFSVAGDSEGTAFFRTVAGLDRPGLHLLRSLLSAGQLVMIVFLAGFGGLACRLVKRKQHAGAVLAFAALAVSAGLVWQWAEVRIFQATPLVALAVALICLARDRKDPLLLLAAFVLFSAPRVLLQFHPMWYGFFLIVPAYPFIVYALGVRAASWLPGRRAVASALAALALLLVWRFESRMWQEYRGKTSVLLTAKGSLRDDAGGRVEAIADFLDYAETRLVPRKPTMVVLPEGVSLNYFTGLRNPTAYYLFTPPEIGSPMVEERMIRELDATKPDVLLLTSRDLKEFGRRGIGLDYALELGDWIRGSYDLERIFEAGDGRPWRLVLLRRREAR